MVHTDVVWSVRVVAHDCALFASVLASLLYCVCVPVRPVNPVLEEGNGKDVGKGTRNGPVSVLAVQVGKAESRYGKGLIHV